MTCYLYRCFNATGELLYVGVAQNALTYALGRALLPTDTPYLNIITTEPKTGSLGMRDVLMNVVASDTFRMRRGDNTTSPTGVMQ